MDLNHELLMWTPRAVANPPDRFTFDIAFDSVFTNCSDVVVEHLQVTETVIVAVHANDDITAEMRHVLGSILYRNERTGGFDSD